MAKIRKICESLGATIYPVDENGEKRRVGAMDVISRIEDLKQVKWTLMGLKEWRGGVTGYVTIRLRKLTHSFPHPKSPYYIGPQ